MTGLLREKFSIADLAQLKEKTEQFSQDTMMPQKNQNNPSQKSKTRLTKNLLHQKRRISLP
jgi:hypothetical protein